MSYAQNWYKALLKINYHFFVSMGAGKTMRYSGLAYKRENIQCSFLLCSALQLSVIWILTQFTQTFGKLYHR